MKTADAHNKDLTGRVEMNGGRFSGKKTDAVMHFVAEGECGHKAVYTTPNGTFYSPEAHKAALTAERERITKAVGEITKYENTKFPGIRMVLLEQVLSIINQEKPAQKVTP